LLTCKCEEWLVVELTELELMAELHQWTGKSTK